MNNSKIVLINTILFFVGWNAILLAGADHPPPVGFLWLVLLIAILDFVQYKYLSFFLPQLLQSKKISFVKNLFFFTMGGILISLLCMLVRFESISKVGVYDNYVWVAVITVVGAIYGICFWFFNILLVKMLSSK